MARGAVRQEPRGCAVKANLGHVEDAHDGDDRGLRGRDRHTFREAGDVDGRNVCPARLGVGVPAGRDVSSISTRSLPSWTRVARTWLIRRPTRSTLVVISPSPISGGERKWALAASGWGRRAGASGAPMRGGPSGLPRRIRGEDGQTRGAGQGRHQVAAVRPTADGPLREQAGGESRWAERGDGGGLVEAGHVPNVCQ